MAFFPLLPPSLTCASFVKSNTCLFNIQRFALIVSYIWNSPPRAKLDSALMSSAPSAFLIISALSNNDHWCFKQGIQAFDQVWVEALKGRMRRVPLDSRLHTLKARRPKTPAHKLPSAAAVHPSLKQLFVGPVLRIYTPAEWQFFEDPTPPGSQFLGSLHLLDVSCWRIPPLGGCRLVLFLVKKTEFLHFH